MDGGLLTATLWFPTSSLVIPSASLGRFDFLVSSLINVGKYGVGLRVFKVQLSFIGQCIQGWLGPAITRGREGEKSGQQNYKASRFLEVQSTGYMCHLRHG